jgi:cob(I)alamin adenosyltransferase
MARIYTRGGDGGETSLGDGTRVPKSAARVTAYGDVDELNSVLGCAAAALAHDPAPTDLVPRLAAIQSVLLDLGAVLADPGAAADMPDFGAADLEAWIDGYEDALPPLANFILPGGTAGAALLHLGRTVCRRAERRVVALAAAEPVPAAAVTYLNRLSDFLFTAARAANAAAGTPDVAWRRGS